MAYQQIFEDQNEYGRKQTYLIDCRCEKIAICKSCHSPYTNRTGNMMCSDCNDPHHERDPGTFEGTNEYGHPQLYEVVDGQKHPVCTQCHAAVMPNRGQGTVCDACHTEFMMECAHDEAF